MADDPKIPPTEGEGADRAASDDPGGAGLRAGVNPAAEGAAKTSPMPGTAPVVSKTSEAMPGSPDLPPKPAAPVAAAAPAAPGAPKPPPKPPVPKPPAVPQPDLAGRTTTAAATALKPPAPTAKSRAADDTSPLMSRRAWIGLSWGAFTAASTVALAATGRFMFPNVLNEPPQQFKAGLPNDYGFGVDERYKETFGVWLVRTPNDIIHNASGFYALLVTCTHLGCTPNYLSAEGKFKCPCHGSGFRPTGINFEGPAPRPLERCRIVLADDGQILVDKSRKFQQELGQWLDPEAFLKV